MKSDITVVEAREKLKDISTIYHSYPTRSRKAQLVTAKKALDKAYMDAETAFINGKIDDISNLHVCLGSHQPFLKISRFQKFKYVTHSIFQHMSLPWRS